jgi:hypothetical protein
MQRHRRYDLFPDVKAAEFGVEWHKWWRFIQPGWRTDETRVLPDAADWAALASGGPNGLFLVIMSLSWWARADKIQSNKVSDKFMLAVDEVHWVMTEILKTNPVQVTGQKRSMDDASEDQPGAKR